MFTGLVFEKAEKGNGTRVKIFVTGSLGGLLTTSMANQVVKRRVQDKITKYFKESMFSATRCGFGVDLNPAIESWSLDLSGCGIKEFGKWREEFADLEALDLSNNELEVLPG
ncbi:hypothetical protein TeGR_g13231, partial [Tetraparma gracilis]